MKKAPLAKRLGKLIAGKPSQPAAIWHPLDRLYPRLLDFDPGAAGLTGKLGVYAIWHLGIRPQWLRVGANQDLGTAFGAFARTAWIQTFHGNAGVFIAWAVPPQNQCAGMAGFLAEKLRPSFQGEAYSGDLALDSSVTPIAYPLPPGTQE